MVLVSAYHLSICMQQLFIPLPTLYFQAFHPLTPVVALCALSFDHIDLSRLSRLEHLLNV